MLINTKSRSVVGQSGATDKEGESAPWGFLISNFLTSIGSVTFFFNNSQMADGYQPTADLLSEN